MENCKTCKKPIPIRRYELGYKTCVGCSTEAKWSGIQVVHHKTGNEIQIVKDPEVAAEFIEKTKRQGFGTMKGIKNSTKSNSNQINPERRQKKIKPTPIKSHVVTSKKKVTVDYRDAEIGEKIMDVFDTFGSDAAKKLLESEFQSLKISPVCRKQILHILESSSINH